VYLTINLHTEGSLRPVCRPEAACDSVLKVATYQTAFPIGRCIGRRPPTPFTIVSRSSARSGKPRCFFA